VTRSPAWWAGAALQALVLGVGLFLALLRLAQVATDAQIFRYQGF
jgi:hypothetical protein